MFCNLFFVVIVCGWNSAALFFPVFLEHSCGIYIINFWCWPHPFSDMNIWTRKHTIDVHSGIAFHPKDSYTFVHPFTPRGNNYVASVPTCIFGQWEETREFSGNPKNIWEHVKHIRAGCLSSGSNWGCWNFEAPVHPTVPPRHSLCVVQVRKFSWDIRQIITIAYLTDGKVTELYLIQKKFLHWTGVPFNRIFRLKKIHFNIYINSNIVPHIIYATLPMMCN